MCVSHVLNEFGNEALDNTYKKWAPAQLGPNFTIFAFCVYLKSWANNAFESKPEIRIFFR